MGFLSTYFGYESLASRKDAKTQSNFLSVLAPLREILIYFSMNTKSSG